MTTPNQSPEIAAKIAWDAYVEILYKDHSLPKWEFAPTNVRDAWTFSVTAANRHLLTLLAERDLEIGELGADEARLNWWLEHQWVRFAWIDDDVCHCIDIEGPGAPYATGKLLGVGTNERTAIDAARKEDRNGD